MSIVETSPYFLEEQRTLIKRCITGDRISQGKLYHAYAPKMMAVCLWYAKTREEAEEILQDGFVRIFTYLHTYSHKGSFEGWIRKVMVSAALSKYRNKSSHLRPVLELDNEFPDAYEEPGFIDNYDEKKLLELIRSLSPAYRLVFNLYVFEGMKHREIAEALNISEGTSKSNLSDARKILQTALTVRKNKISI